MFRAGIYMGWVGYLNLGDEAMYDLCREIYPSVSWTSYETLAYRTSPSEFLSRSRGDFRYLAARLSEEFVTQRRFRNYARKAMHKTARLTGTEIAIFGGGTFINRSDAMLRTYQQARKRVGRPVPTFGSGVADADFWKQHESGWTDRSKEWVAAFEELPVVGVRGPLSKARLEEAGARNVLICGDPAVAFHAPYANQAGRERRDGPLRVGINAGSCSGKLFGRQEDVQEALASAARWLRDAGHRVEIIPVWINDIDACLDVARRAELDRSLVSPVCYSRDAFLSRVEKLDMLVSLKLHAGILAAAANIPFVSLEYRSKCRDFAASLGWEDFLIRTDQLGDGVLIDRIAELIPQLNEKRNKLCQNMCCLMKGFESYCQTIEPLVLGQDWSTSWRERFPHPSRRTNGRAS